MMSARNCRFEEPDDGRCYIETRDENYRGHSYNFVRPRRALRFGRETRTPAMQAGLATRRLTFREVFVCALTLLLEKVSRAFHGACTRAAATDVLTHT